VPFAKGIAPLKEGFVHGVVVMVMVMVMSTSMAMVMAMATLGREYSHGSEFPISRYS
jgi:hypothetical protein